MTSLSKDKCWVMGEKPLQWRLLTPQPYRHLLSMWKEYFGKWRRGVWILVTLLGNFYTCSRTRATDAGRNHLSFKLAWVWQQAFLCSLSQGFSPRAELQSTEGTWTQAEPLPMLRGLEIMFGVQSEAPRCAARMGVWDSPRARHRPAYSLLGVITVSHTRLLPISHLLQHTDRPGEHVMPSLPPRS